MPSNNSIMKCLVVNLFILINCFHALAQMEFKLLAQWKQLDFAFPSEQVKQMAIRKGQFVMGNAVPLDTQVHYRGIDWGNNYFNNFNWLLSTKFIFLLKFCQIKNSINEKFHSKLLIVFQVKLVLFRQNTF